MLLQYRMLLLQSQQGIGIRFFQWGGEQSRTVCEDNPLSISFPPGLLMFIILDFTVFTIFSRAT